METRFVKFYILNTSTYCATTLREQCVDGSLARTKSAPLNLMHLTSPTLGLVSNPGSGGQPQNLRAPGPGLTRTFTRQFSQPIVFSSDSEDEEEEANGVCASASPHKVQRPTDTAADSTVTGKDARLRATGLYRTELQEVVSAEDHGRANRQVLTDVDGAPQRWLLIGEDARVRAALEHHGAAVTTVTNATAMATATAGAGAIPQSLLDMDGGDGPFSVEASPRSAISPSQHNTDWIREAVNGAGSNDPAGASWAGVAVCETLSWAAPLLHASGASLVNDATSSSRVARAAERSADLVMSAIQAIMNNASASASAANATNAPTQLLVCTSGAFSAAATYQRDCEPRPAASALPVTHAPLAAMCRVANADHPKKLRCAVLDLQLETAFIPPGAFDALFSTSGGGEGIDATTSEDEVIVIANKIYAPRLRRFSLDDDRSDSDHEPISRRLGRVFQSQSCCVITGGTGGLGVLHAKWIVENTQCRRLGGVRFETKSCYSSTHELTAPRRLVSTACHHLHTHGFNSLS